MTGNASSHMDRGDDLLKAYVKHCINGTAFQVENEPVEELHDREEVGFGTTAFRVYATDPAISALGDGGENALRALGDRLRESAQQSSKHIFALIDTDANGRLRFEKLIAR